MGSRRHPLALTVPLALLAAAPGFAQTSGAALVGPPDRIESPAPAALPLPDFRSPPDDLRRAGEPRRNGLIAAYPLSENLQIGVGRFEVPELPRPRTHMERDSQPTSVRPRDRGIAAIGFSLRF